jgi:hypothetical protein
MSSVSDSTSAQTSPGAASSLKISPSVDQIETALAQAQDLKKWWAEVEAGQASVERFQLFPAYPGMEPVYGFFGEAPVQGQTIPVMGDYGNYFFDRPRVPDSEQEHAAQWMLKQAEEFALHYWMRVQGWALPESYPELDRLQAPRYLQSFSWCFPADPELAGMANVQRYYKLRGSGLVGEFPARNNTAIVDLRDLQTTYEWITVDKRLFDFNVTVSTDNDLLSLVVPIGSTMHLVLNESLIVNQPEREGRVLGAFGVGFGLISGPATGVINFGPDKVQPALGLQYLEVRDSGEIRLRTVTIMATPAKLLNLSLDPLNWGLQAADLMTLGAAEPLTSPVQKRLKQLPLPKLGFDPLLTSSGILNRLIPDGGKKQLLASKDHYRKEILAKDALGLRQALLGTRPTWLQVPDWVNGPIPDWVRRGQITAPGAVK